MDWYKLLQGALTLVVAFALRWFLAWIGVEMADEQFVAFVAAIVASVLGYVVLFLAAPALQSYQINIQPTLDAATFYAGFGLLGMILIGAIIGVVSSLLATRRYLKL